MSRQTVELYSEGDITDAMILQEIDTIEHASTAHAALHPRNLNEDKGHSVIAELDSESPYLSFSFGCGQISELDDLEYLEKTGYAYPPLGYIGHTRLLFHLPEGQGEFFLVTRDAQTLAELKDEVTVSAQSQRVIRLGNASGSIFVGRNDLPHPELLGNKTIASRKQGFIAYGGGESGYGVGIVDTHSTYGMTVFDRRGVTHRYKPEKYPAWEPLLRTAFL